ncbi:MAG: cytochrome c family protein [Reyranellaceae bacterium]
MRAALAALLGLGLAWPATAQDADAARGQRVFNQQCRACHTVNAGGASPVGPNLHGLIGRKAGTVDGFAYSDAMKASGLTWDEATLADYLRDPKAKVPGTKMVFAGLKQAPQIADLVAYLKQAMP